MAEIKSAIGRASVEDYEEDGEYSYWLWEYPSYGMGLFFREAENLRLCSIEIDCKSDARLLREPLFPGTRETVTDLLRRNLAEGELAAIEEQASDSELSLYVPSLRGTFYFDDSDILQAQLQWGPYFDDSGDFPVAGEVTSLGAGSARDLRTTEEPTHAF